MALILTRDPDADSIPPRYREACAVCGDKTLFWYTPKDVAVCEPCGALCGHDDVPSKREWFISQGVSIPEDWTCAADRENREPMEVSRGRPSRRVLV